MEQQTNHTEETNASRQFEDWYERLQENIPEVSLEPLIEFQHLVRGDSNTSVPIHRWYSLKESYSAEFPGWALNRIETKYKLKPKEILDPCVGGGTTGISLGLKGLNVVGVEYNPFIRFVAETKASAFRIDKNALEKAVKKLQLKNYSTAVIEIPNMSTLLNRNYVSKKNLNVLLGIQNEIKSLKTSQDIKNLLCLGVAASIEYAFNLRKDGRALRYAPKRALSNITKTVFQKYAEFLVDVENVQKSEHNKGSNVFEVIAGSAVSLRDFEKDGQKYDLADNSFDAVIYSPPYLNNFDYSEVYKLELWLMGFIEDYDAWKTLRLGTIRSHPSIKFSETNNLLGNPATELIHQKLIEMGRSACIPNTRREAVARTICGYFDDMYLALREQFRVMKKGAVICYVVANSRHYYLPIATDVILAEIARNIGFQPLELVTLRKRNGRTRQKTFLRETAVFMKKA
jgi:DNA modification methylase